MVERAGDRHALSPLVRVGVRVWRRRRRQQALQCPRARYCACARARVFVRASVCACERVCVRARTHLDVVGHLVERRAHEAHLGLPGRRDAARGGERAGGRAGQEGGGEEGELPVRALRWAVRAGGGQ